MTERPASISYCPADGTLKIEGSELFVSQQMDTFREYILASLEAHALMSSPIPQITHVKENSSSSGLEGSSKAYAPESVTPSNPFPRVLDQMNGKLKITTTIKGKNMADRAIKLVLAYLWGKETLLGEGTAEYKELRDLCEEHGCLDSSNFSTTLNSKRSLILVDGTKGSSSKLCKLTYPGRDVAKEVLNELNGGEQ